MLKIIISLFASLWSIPLIHAQAIIPLPQKIEAGEGSFVLNRHTVICDRGGFASESHVLQQEIASLTGLVLPITHSMPQGDEAICLDKDASIEGLESYRLRINKKSIIVNASHPAGAFYGCMSLLQLMRVDTLTSSVAIPAFSIEDSPRFVWRGLMLDVSRTFMPPDYIRKTIRRMAFYKLNKLHLHLTDDQGWRIPIQSYPLLAKKAAYFDTSYHEPAEFQGHYTRKDIQELVRYAAERHVELVPEIESPGHSHAALNAYPSLSCTGHITPVFPFFSGPSVTEDVFCVGNPSSLEFFKSVIKETASLFPSGYLHLGGDEVPRTNWEKCLKCQALVLRLKLDNTGALQGYFMQELHDQAVKAGKRPVAWDEILIDNKFLSKDWVIMSWRGSKPGLDAAEKGYDVVMTPYSHLYFDYPYNKIDTKMVFSFDPFEGGIADSMRRHILGIQANFWSHIDRTQSKIDYQIYPRLLALAERAWSSADDLDFDSFRNRQRMHRFWLDYLKVRYNEDDF